MAGKEEAGVYAEQGHAPSAAAQQGQRKCEPSFPLGGHTTTPKCAGLFQAKRKGNPSETAVSIRSPCRTHPGPTAQVPPAAPTAPSTCPSIEQADRRGCGEQVGEAPRSGHAEKRGPMQVKPGVSVAELA